MEKLEIASRDPEKKTIAFIMFAAGVLIWFLIDSTKPLVHDLIKAIGFFLFGYGLICLSKWKPWHELSSREKKMRLIFIAIIAVLLITIILVLFLRK